MIIVKAMPTSTKPRRGGMIIDTKQKMLNNLYRTLTGRR